MDQSVHGLAFVENLSYIGTFLAVAFSGYAIPIPEELILILGGFLAAERISSLPIMIAVSVSGAIFGDTLIYYLSGHGSRFTQKYHKHVEKTHAGWYLRRMRENTFETILLSRFIVGMRFLNPLVSGLMRVPWQTFISATALSAALYIPIVILVGYFFHHQIHMIIRVAESIRHYLVLGLVVGSVILILLILKNLLERKR